MAQSPTERALFLVRQCAEAQRLYSADKLRGAARVLRSVADKIEREANENDRAERESPKNQDAFFFAKDKKHAKRYGKRRTTY